MHSDRYLKIILTVIAIQLFWIGLRDVAPGVSAQQAATPVVIRGIEMDGQMLPVLVVGAREPLPVRTGVVQIESLEPLRIQADQPIRVEVDQPLKVETVPYVPAPRPGE